MDKDLTFVVFRRSITNWEWYTDANTARLFFHLIIIANHKDTKFRGMAIARGQVLTSYSKLAGELNLSVKQIRVAINHLKKTKNVACERASNGVLVTIENYNTYQGNVADNRADLGADRGQTEGRLGATNNNDNNENNINNNINIIRGTDEPQVVATRKIIARWNELPVTSVFRISQDSTRYKLLSARVKEYGVEGVLEAIDNIARSSFLLGQNSKGWSIKFDWFVRPNNFIKVLEGNYTDKTLAKAEHIMPDDVFDKIVANTEGADRW